MTVLVFRVAFAARASDYKAGFECPKWQMFVSYYHNTHVNYPVLRAVRVGAADVESLAVPDRLQHPDVISALEGFRLALAHTPSDITGF